MVQFSPCHAINVIQLYICDTILTDFIYLYLNAIPNTNMYDVIVHILCVCEIK